MTLIGEPGSGKTTLLNRLIRRPRFRGIVVSASPELVTEGTAAALVAVPLGTEGGEEIVKLAARLGVGDWIVVDDVEDYVHPWMSREGLFERFLCHRKNAYLNVALAMKDPYEGPKRLRNVTTWWIVAPPREPGIARYLRDRGIPSAPLPALGFYSGPRAGPFETADVKTLDFSPIGL